eukprot:TRINITY_DN13045_c0_g1_i1.p1 TRINITY_DN13045_c0_g1~~TRINITY_DN13045_c0_g1_i1.p1  ORF type:complete len:333 (-),score=59.55 TRINITY_DN13045_c0_g1_i1:229-1227(-)
MCIRDRPVSPTVSEPHGATHPSTVSAQPSSSAQRALFVDGFPVIYRSYFATPKLINSAGHPVGAVSSFVRTLLRLQQKFSDVTHFGVMLDSSGPSFRSQVYPEYKGNRPGTPEDLRPQLTMIEQFLRVSGIPVIKAPGWEADDLLASYTAAALDQLPGSDITIVSTDKDIYQMVNSRVSVFNPYKKDPKTKTKGLFVDPEYVISEFGVPPAQVTDVQGLAGDSCDNVPGVKGVGMKTACKLVLRYGSLEGVLAAAAREDSDMTPRARNMLNVDAEMARMSLDLVTLRQDAPLTLPLEDLQCVRRSHRWKEDTISWLQANGLHGVVNTRDSYF